MSMQTDSAFIRAISSDKSLMSAIGGRLYGTAIPLPDSEADNVPLPYAIVTFDGLTNDIESKDWDAMEGAEDVVNVSVELTARTLEDLHTLAESMRETVREYMSDGDADDTARPTQYDFSTGSINYDASKPCYWMTFHYRCVTDAAS